jgi:hypothetical protein
MKSKNNQIQQGDVLLAPITKLPPGCKVAKKDKRGVVLAEGETSGHYHGIEESGVSLMEAPTGERYIVNETDHPVSLTHQEHKPITVNPGVFQIGIVREKDWFTEMVRNVVD